MGRALLLSAALRAGLGAYVGAGLAACLGAGCADRTVVLSLPQGAVSAILIDHGAQVSEVRAIDPGAAEPLRIDDTRGPHLVLLAYDRPLDALAIEPAADGTIALASAAASAEGWPLPAPTAWRAYQGPDGELVDHAGSDPLDARTAGLSLRRPRCAAVTGYDATRVPLDRDFRETYLAALDRDVSLVAALHFPDDDLATTATLTFHRAERGGGVQRAALTLRTSTLTKVGAVSDADGTWVVVAEPERTRLFLADEDGDLTPDRVLEGSIDPRTLHVLRDGRWVGVGTRPPVVRVLRPSATAWDTLVSGPHPDPAFERRCKDADLHPWLSLASDGTAWVGAVGMGLYRVALDRPGTWSDRESLPASGPFCAVQQVTLAGGAEVVFASRLMGLEDAERFAWWRRDGEAPWTALPEYQPINLFAHAGRAIGVSSNGFVDTFDFEPRRPELPPRRCAHAPVVATRARGFEDQLVVSGDGGLADQGVSGVLVQWLEYVSR